MIVTLNKIKDQAIYFDFVIVLVMMLVTKRPWSSINEHVFTNIFENFFHGYQPMWKQCYFL